MRSMPFSAGGSALDDTWTWDGARWARLHPAVSPRLASLEVTPGRGPKPQAAGSLLMAYDAAHRDLVLYGVPGGTWTWDGRTWRSHPAPPPTGGVAIAYDPASRAVLLYTAPAGGAHQTWRWDGATWTDAHPRTTPDVVEGAMAADGRRLLLFGAPFGLVQGQPLTETWAWDGSDWSLLAPAVRVPIDSYAAAYDQADGRLVAFTEPGAETWVWDGAAWAREHPRHEPPSRSGAAAWYDPRTHRVLLYGGHVQSSALGDLWAWDGGDWSLLKETKR